MAQLRWQQAEGKRHALVVGRCQAELDEPFEALCRLVVTPRRGDFIALGGTWLDPTCSDCHTAWLGMSATSTGILL